MVWNSRRAALTALLGAASIFFVGGPPAASAQARSTEPTKPAGRAAPAPAESTAPPVFFDDQNARGTQQRLREILRQYPPAVEQVLRLDPSLMGRDDYLAPYPALAAFLMQHPEVARNPAFFFGQARFEEPPTARIRAINLFEDVLGGLALFLGFVTLVTAFTWTIRQVIEHRRWLRVTKMQTEAHSKLLDRLTSNDDLLAYIQTPAGRHFLESAPIPMSQESRGVSAPIGRILWSVQAGVVLAVVGLGVWSVKSTLIEELAGPMYVVSVLAISLGAGFVLSALVAYVLSQRLGLLEPPKA